MHAANVKLGFMQPLYMDCMLRALSDAREFVQKNPENIFLYKHTHVFVHCQTNLNLKGSKGTDRKGKREGGMAARCKNVKNNIFINSFRAGIIISTAFPVSTLSSGKNIPRYPSRNEEEECSFLFVCLHLAALALFFQPLKILLPPPP